MPASADQPLDVGLHQQLQDALGYSTQKVIVAGLLQKLIQWQSLLGHRGFSGQREVEQLHPRPPAAVTTPTPPPDRRVFPPPIPPEITPRPWTLPRRLIERNDAANKVHNTLQELLLSVCNLQ